MTETHAANISSRLREIADSFDRAKASDDWSAAHKLQLDLFSILNHVVREGRAARIEADALATELLVYRPTRSGKPPAPPLSGYCYVFTARFPWVCAAVERREVLTIPGIGLTHDYTQECYTPERKTVCGKATTFPVKERFPSGGWPRLHELCPDCVRSLVKSGLIASPVEAS